MDTEAAIARCETNEETLQNIKPNIQFLHNDYFNDKVQVYLGNFFNLSNELKYGH